MHRKDTTAQFDTQHIHANWDSLKQNHINDQAQVLIFFDPGANPYNIEEMVRSIGKVIRETRLQDFDQKQRLLSLRKDTT